MAVGRDRNSGIMDRMVEGSCSIEVKAQGSIGPEESKADYSGFTDVEKACQVWIQALLPFRWWSGEIIPPLFASDFSSIEKILIGLLWDLNELKQCLVNGRCSVNINDKTMLMIMIIIVVVVLMVMAVDFFACTWTYWYCHIVSQGSSLFHLRQLEQLESSPPTSTQEGSFLCHITWNVWSCCH